MLTFFIVVDHSYLKFIINAPMMEISMGEYPINTSTNWSKFGHWRIFDTHSKQQNLY